MNSSWLVLLVGLQGTGKSLLANGMMRLATRPIVYLSIGEECRKLRRPEADAGDPVPDEIVNGMLVRLFDDHPGSILVVDGYNRLTSQTEFLLEQLRQREMLLRTFVVVLEAPKKVVWDRLRLRALIEKRVDDSPEKIRKRIRQYYEKTVPATTLLQATLPPDHCFYVDATPAPEVVLRNTIGMFPRRHSILELA